MWMLLSGCSDTSADAVVGGAGLRGTQSVRGNGRTPLCKSRVREVRYIRTVVST